jgi:cytochrome o ubiquinol oxidase operon protein cyoD
MSGHEEDWEQDDRAPGDEHVGGAGWSAIQVYLLGLLLAVGLTVASFWIAGSHLLWGPGIPAALLALAVAQIGVHLVFFLHLTSGPENTNNILALAFGVLIVLLVVVGSVWIMGNMMHNMMPMPMDAVMNMQS